jgi:UDP-N-acetylglucosamine enolpyruvyl transferase
MPTDNLNISKPIEGLETNPIKVHVANINKIFVRAKITGVGSNLLHIEGVNSLGGCKHRMLPDMIEIGSFIGLAAVTNSDITIKNCAVQSLG